MTAVSGKKGYPLGMRWKMIWRKKTRGSRYRYPFAETDGENDTDSSQRVSDNSGLHDDGPALNRQAFWLTGVELEPNGRALPLDGSSKVACGGVRSRSQQRLVCDGFSPSFLLTGSLSPVELRQRSRTCQLRLD
jgi:hypothetical protein